MNTNKTNRFAMIAFSFKDSIKTIFTDTGALLILIFAAVFYPVVYSIAYQNEVLSDIPVIVVDNDNSALSRKWCNMLDATPSVNIAIETTDLPHAEQLFWNGTGNAILVIPVGFERDVLKGVQTSVSMYADASNFIFYKETFRSTMQATGVLSAGINFKKLVAKGMNATQAKNEIRPLETNAYNLYNPSGGYGSFVMPGIMLVIIQQTMLIGIGLVGGAGRERKRVAGHADTINIINFPFEVIFGKALAYFSIGLFNMVFSSVVVYHWFNYPSNGSMLDVLMLAVPYLFSTIFLGLSISVFFKHREHSIMFLVFLSPIVLFISGLSWPSHSIPFGLYNIFKIFPSSQMVPAYIRIQTMGSTLSDVLPEFKGLLLQMLAYGAMAVIIFKIAIKKQKVI